MALAALVLGLASPLRAGDSWTILATSHYINQAAEIDYATVERIVREVASVDSNGAVHLKTSIILIESRVEGQAVPPAPGATPEKYEETVAPSGFLTEATSPGDEVSRKQELATGLLFLPEADRRGVGLHLSVGSLRFSVTPRANEAIPWMHASVSVIDTDAKPPSEAAGEIVFKPGCPVPVEFHLRFDRVRLPGGVENAILEYKTELVGAKLSRSSQ